MAFIDTNFQDFCSRYDANPQPVIEVFNTLNPLLLSNESVMLAGGALRRTLLKQPLDSDFDFFFRSEDIKRQFEDNLPKTLVKTKETTHHSQYEGLLQLNGIEQQVKVQSVYFDYFASPQDLISSFDYTITQFAYTQSGSLITTPEALWDCSRKRLAVNKITYPTSSLRRLLKYTNQGFTACGGCLQEILVQSAPLIGSQQMEIQYVD
jgi:hypothetical protein